MEFFSRLKKYDIILGSNSPRRKQLLEQSGIPFRVLGKQTSEDFPKSLSPEEIVLFLSKNKSKAYTEELSAKNTIVITADTIVISDGEILNKPSDAAEAEKMLRSLSGKTHEVYTGVTISSNSDSTCFFDKTLVSFAKLSKEEITYYINNFKPFDKAGSYGIQEWLGLIGIDRIEGSYHNVVGLPVQKVYAVLKSFINE